MTAASVRPPGILMVVTWSLGEDTGYTVNAKRTIGALQRAGHEVHVCQVVDRSRFMSARRYARQHGGQVVLRLPDFGWPRLRSRADSRISRTIARICAHRTPDVVHARGIRAGAVCDKVRGVPVLLDVRGDIVSEVAAAYAHAPAYRRTARVKSAGKDEARAIRCADGVSVVSAGMRDWLSSRYETVRALPLAVIPCAVERQNHAFQLMEGGFTVVYAGGMHEYQPPELVFREIARIARVAHATDIEVYTPRLDRTVMEARTRLCAAARVSSLAADRVLDRLAAADLGVIPRTADPTNAVACPTKIAEYLSAGLPIVISPNLGEWPAMLQEWKVGISSDADDNALALFAESVRARREEYRLRCLAVAQAHFSMESAVAKLQRLYRALSVSRLSE